MSKVRGHARAQGIPFDGTAGPRNAINDVGHVCVGHSCKSHGTTRTGVTAILPRGNTTKAGIDSSVMAAFFSLNGNGEMTGTHLIEELGFLEGPILLTNTASVGDVRSWVIQYARDNPGSDADPDEFGLIVPVVAETYDGWLNDILGFHVTQDMVKEAINTASCTNTDEGNVGAGTGTTCYSWKGGIGTASRRVTIYRCNNETPIKNHHDPLAKGEFTVGVLVQANQGTYWDLVIRGVPMGQDTDFAPPPDSPDNFPGTGLKKPKPRKSSIIVVIATDAPLLPHQLKRLARRATHGIARTGTITDDDSGELIVAFSTANPDAAASDDHIVKVEMIPNDDMDPLFEATVQATEEAILNALCAGRTVTGYQGNTAYAITDAPATDLTLEAMLKKYHRYQAP